MHNKYACGCFADKKSYEEIMPDNRPEKHLPGWHLKYSLCGCYRDVMAVLHGVRVPPEKGKQIIVTNIKSNNHLLQYFCGLNPFAIMRLQCNLVQITNLLNL